MPVAKTKHSRSQQQRTKTFTGCWTCRARHVKCDEQKPGCRRCHNANIPCQGYDVRLIWTETTQGSDQPISGDHEALALVSRRRVRSGIPPRLSAPYLSQFQITTILNDLEDRSNVDSSQGECLFSVFSATDPPSSVGHTQRVVDLDRSLDATEPQPLPNCLAGDPHSPGLVDDSNQTYEAYDNARTCPNECENVSRYREEIFVSATEADLPTDLTEDSSSPIAHSPSSEDSNHTTRRQEVMEPHFENLLANKEQGADRPFHKDALSSPMLQRAQTLQKGQAPSIPRHIDLLPLPAHQLELIHHWITFLCSNMLPLDRIDNPCRNLIAPMALIGLTSTSGQLSGNIATFHAICSAAAYSMSQLQGQDSHFQILAVKHEQLALNHLRHGIGRGSGEDQESLLMAILMCITSEAISGNAGRWRTHLIGGLNLLQQMAFDDCFPAQSQSPIYLDYLCLATLCNLTIPAELMTYLATHPNKDNYLEKSYGITRPILETLIAINTMAYSKSNLDPQQVDILETQLYLSVPGRLKLEVIDARSAAVMYCIANVYYYAVIVYFKRSLRCAAARDMQHIVEKGLHNLELADVFRGNTGGCICAWPCIVIGAECENPELQQRMLTFFERKQQLGFKNFDIACDIVTTVWRKRASTAPPVDVHWQDILSNTHLDVFPL